jgi:replicative DNA helicase
MTKHMYNSSTPFREPPSNLEAEQALIGTLLINNDALKILPPGLETGHFHEPLHRALFEAAKACARAGRNINPVTLRGFLSPEMAARSVGEITVSAYLARLAVSAAPAMHAPDFAAAIMLCAQRRAALGLAEGIEVAAWCAEDETEFAEHIRENRDRLTDIITLIEGQDEGAAGFAEAIDRALDSTSDAARGLEPMGIDPGIPALAALTGPWQKGQLIIIGGGVKQGKSALAMQSLFTIAEKHAVALNSGEMSRNQLIMREKARRTGISASRQQRGRVSESDFEALVKAGVEMKRLKPVHIDCRRLTLPQIDAQIGRLTAETGVEAYFLDHIGKIQWTGRMEYEDEFKQGQRATSTLKDLAQKHDIPIIALTHLKKSAFQDYQGRSFRERLNAAINRRPTYRDLVGNMDKDADQVVIVFQAKPIVAGMEPGAGTEDYLAWEEAMERVSGRAELLLSLSRESEFPRRREVAWDGRTTSYGATFNQTQNSRELFQ